MLSLLSRMLTGSSLTSSALPMARIPSMKKMGIQSFAVPTEGRKNQPHTMRMGMLLRRKTVKPVHIVTMMVCTPLLRSAQIRITLELGKQMFPPQGLPAPAVRTGQFQPAVNPTIQLIRGMEAPVHAVHQASISNWASSANRSY